MRAKTSEKEKVIALRKQGKTYAEILEVVPVAKSSISLWLRDVGLSKRQKQRLTAKKKTSRQRGGNTRRQQRIDLTAQIIADGKREVGKLSKRERWLIGAALYWAEGYKSKPWSPSTMVDFANSDPYMAHFFVKWLQDSCGVTKQDIKIRLYIHENHKHRVGEAKKHWMKYTGLPNENFVYTYFKKHKPHTKRKNIDNERYFGLISIQVRRSTNLNRKIEGWFSGIVEDYCRVV